jgi:hypothetical protein
MLIWSHEYSITQCSNYKKRTVCLRAAVYWSGRKHNTEYK